MTNADTIIARIGQAEHRERQFSSDLDRLKRDRDVTSNRSQVMQKESELAAVRREIKELEYQLRQCK